MDDLSQKLAGILNDPGMLSEIERLAEGLLGSKGEETDKKTAPALEGIDPAQMANIIGILNHLKSESHDERSQLLLALRPLLSAPKQQKVDTAIKLLKMIDILPLLKDSGIFNI